MPTSRYRAWTFGRRGLAVAVVATLTACSTAPPFEPQLRSTSPIVSVAGKGCPASVVYVVARYDQGIEEFDPSNLHAGPCGSIGVFKSIGGLFTDSKGNLWVTDRGARQIFAFAPGSKMPLQTLNDPTGVPIAVVVNERSNTAYVTDYQNDGDASTLVEVYAHGSATPTGTLHDPVARNGAFDALDDRGNLYVTFMTQSNTAQVDRWTGGAGTPQNLGLQLVSAGAIATTASGALAVCDPFAYRCGTFAPGSVTMSHVFAHMGRNRNGVIGDKPPILHPDALALDRRERRAYVAAGSLTQWTFPGPAHRPNRLPLDEVKVAGGAGAGIAISPASGPGSPY